MSASTRPSGTAQNCHVPISTINLLIQYLQSDSLLTEPIGYQYTVWKPNTGTKCEEESLVNCHTFSWKIIAHWYHLFFAQIPHRCNCCHQIPIRHHGTRRARGMYVLIKA